MTRIECDVVARGRGREGAGLRSFDTPPLVGDYVEINRDAIARVVHRRWSLAGRLMLICEIENRP